MPMDAKAYTAALAELRGVRDEIKRADSALAKPRTDRDKRVRALGGYDKAHADRIAPAAGLSVLDVVALLPGLRPQQPSALVQPEPTDSGVDQAEAAAVPSGPAGAPARDLRRTDERIAPVAAHAAPGERHGQELEDVPATAEALAPAVAAPASAVPAVSAEPVRELPSIPAGEQGDGWFAATANLTSKHPNFTQQSRQMAFLDTSTGVLVHRETTARLELGGRSVAEILTAVYATVPGSVERIYITAGDPWHRDAGRYPFLRDAVAAWMNAPVPGWSVESSRGKDRLAGHLVHPRNPVGRWQRGDQHTEIRSVGEWFDPDGADPATVRDAFVLLWRALHHHWSDVVLMGSPSQTGRDLWSRTIPARTGAKWADKYPVMSEEIRGLLHATAGQGRTELFTPPRVPDKLPQLIEYDRTFAYAKHTWASGVGAPAGSPQPPSRRCRRSTRSTRCSRRRTGTSGSLFPTAGTTWGSSRRRLAATALGAVRPSRAAPSPPGPGERRSTWRCATRSRRGGSRSWTAVPTGNRCHARR
jgi:hypothetical protein